MGTGAPMRPRLLPLLVLAGLSAVPAVARADDVLHPGTPTTDRSTVITLGVRWPLTGDDNFNATVTVRYRSGTGAFRDAMPLHRVHPEVVTGLSVPDQFGGSIFDLAPGTPYDIELHADDPDGPVDAVIRSRARRARCRGPIRRPRTSSR